MSKFRRCDACGKEASERRVPMDPEFIWIDVEANEDVDHFDACSWACTAQIAMNKAVREVSREVVSDE